MTQAGTYRIMGSELSPYSVKVRSYFRYKGIPHRWVVRNQANMAEFERYARLPLIPLVITPQDEGLQDSTPIIERMEQQRPEPTIYPTDPTLAFLSALVEEYADEWVNKPMFHYRWTYEADQESGARRIVAENMADADERSRHGFVEAVKQRMIPRLSFVGSSAATTGQIEASYLRLLEIVEAQLAERPYLFGGRPALADFGLFAQLYQCLGDPTPGALMRQRAPRTVAWIERMLDPRGEGDFESLETLTDTLMPLLSREIAGVLLPWSTANALALEAGEKEFTVELEGRPFTQQTQKYHAKSLAALKRRYAGCNGGSELRRLLEESGCLGWLR